jgi:hypothetical protein
MTDQPDMVIEIEDWHHQCADGCCDEWGKIIRVNGVEVGTHLDDVENALQAVLEHLGHRVLITQVYKDDGKVQ